MLIGKLTVYMCWQSL